MNPNDKILIYNLFPLLVGPFTRWEPHIIRAADLVFNWIFVNPIQKTGSSGSLYSIADYFQFNPLLLDPDIDKSPESQVREVLASVEQLGLKTMIDLVINHCAFDSELTQKHGQWFLRDKHGRIVNPSCSENGKKVVWKDLASFDHKNSSDKEGLYQFILSVIRYYLDLGFKGFRCDAAYQVPARLWKRLIQDIKADYPEIIFVAETLGCTAEQTKRTADAGFDFIFNSSKWWDFSSHWLMKQYNLTREVAPSISFAESHDTIRLCQELEGNRAGLQQRYLFSALFSTGVMMPIGFEFGARKKPHVVKTRPADWEETDIDLRDYIKAVNDIKGRHPIFQEETPTEMLHSENPNILIMWKGSIHIQEEGLLILNKDIHNSQPFYDDHLHDFVEAGAPLIDVSPEGQMDYVPESFSYDLNPGQGLVFVTTRDRLPEE